MIDAVDLVFLQDAVDLAIQHPGRIEIATERLFDDDAPPMTFALLGQPGRAQLSNDLAEELRRSGEIIEIVAAGPVVLVHLLQQLTKAHVGVFVLRVADQIVDARKQRLPARRLDRNRCELAHILIDFAAKLLGGHHRATNPDHRKLGRQQVARR